MFLQLIHFVRLRPNLSLIICATLYSLVLLFFFAFSWGTYVGILLLLVASPIFAAWFKEYKRLWTPQKVSKTEHYYTEGESHSHGQLMAKLHYQQDIPILTLNTTDPKEKGQLIGKLIVRPFLELWDRYIQFLPYAMRLVKPTPHPLSFLKSEIHRLQLNFPGFLLAEMEGFLEVINKHIVDDNRTFWCSRKSITLEDFKAYYAFGDIYKGLGGCGAGVRRRGQTAELMRNLDWYSMGVLGKTTLLKVAPVRRPVEGGPKKVLSITFPPGLLGLSMANDCGFVIALNEATKMSSKRENIGGIPQFLLLRELAEYCVTVEDAITFISHHPPAASHLLTMMDKNGDGAVIQMLPTGSEELFTVRRLDDSSVHTTNHFFDSMGQMIPGSEAMKSSDVRFRAMEKAFQNDKSAREILNASNCRFTVQSMIFTNETLDLNFDEHDAGNLKGQFVSLNLDDVFKQVEYKS